MITEKDTIKCESIFSDDKQHRLYLKKVWNREKPLACVISIHPNLADNILMDTTTFLTVNGIAGLEEYGGVIIVNLFTLLTSKLQMRWARDIDINDLDNDNFIKKAAEEASIIVFAWGRGVASNVRLSNRADQVVELLSKHRGKFRVISDGEKSGVHPLTPGCRNAPWILEPIKSENAVGENGGQDAEACENAPT